jgi:ATP-dependent Lhr-like helicase
LLECIEAGEVRVHCRDTTEPSVLAHEIITARPYAFLDDEETQNRRTNAVHLRRGLTQVQATDLTTIGALDQDAIDRVHTEIAPLPETADDLHDLLSSMVLLRPRNEWSRLWLELVDRGRGRVVINDGVQLWTTTEAFSDACEALAGDHTAVVRVVRGHLELSGVTTADGLSITTTLPPDQVTIGLVSLQREGFAMQGRYRAGCTGAEWVARRLLARIHGYSKRSRRQSFEPVTAQDFMRFLLRWQHVAPGTELAGEAGLVAVLEQLQGFEAAAGAWETELFSRRLHHYEPAWLDGLCHAGEVAWLRLTPRACDDLAVPNAAAPSKATPTAVVLRADLSWLLAATRDSEEAPPHVNGATAEVLQVLRERGASFATDLSATTRRLPDDVERALWDGVARGLVMCDGFAAIRSLIGLRRGPVEPRSWRFSRLRRGAAGTPGVAGRWSLVPAADSDMDRHDLAEAVAEQLLNRWGVLFRDLAVRDCLRLPWREVQWALRRLEDRGLVRGGRFVSGFSGEQYALPTAVDQLARIRKTPRTQERVVVNATDPLNLLGLIVPGETVPAVRTNKVEYIDGLPAARH